MNNAKICAFEEDLEMEDALKTKMEKYIVVVAFRTIENPLILLNNVINHNNIIKKGR